ncbi:DUF4123 domain-containing protein [Paraburkholderia nemoris]|uniref:DUF4123 domain-containing protein n=1 Tax=Paraburkholderia nemoris TaxID=2793076 RepID=UPI0038B7C94B
MDQMEQNIAEQLQDDDWAQWLARLNAAFEEQSASDRPASLYILADSRANSNVEEMLAEVPDMQVTSLWDGLAVESFRDIAPYLIRVSKDDLDNENGARHRLVKRLWNEAKDLHMLTWFWSPITADVITAHLKHYCVYTLPNRQGFYLHFYDNRVLERVRKVWSVAEQKQFVSPFSAIWYRDRELKNVVWANADALAHVASEGSQSLTDQQHVQLLDLGYPDKVALQLKALYGDIVAQLPQHELYRGVVEQLERAARYGIEGDDELLNYVSKGIVLSPRFDEHPAVNARLIRAAQGEITARDALTGVDKEVWGQVAQMPALTSAAQSRIE